MQPRLRKSVKQMAKEYEDTLRKNQELDAKIKRSTRGAKTYETCYGNKLDKAFKGTARSYEVSITNNKDH